MFGLHREQGIHDARRLPEGVGQSRVAKVDVVEHRGNENLIYRTIGQSSLMTRMDTSVRVRPGDAVPVAINMRKIHLFDPVTEQAILTDATHAGGEAGLVDSGRRNDPR
jgi:ABC-type sugar transport system ATPase subunit